MTAQRYENDGRALLAEPIVWVGAPVGVLILAAGAGSLGLPPTVSLLLAVVLGVVGVAGAAYVEHARSLRLEDDRLIAQSETPMGSDESVVPLEDIAFVVVGDDGSFGTRRFRFVRSGYDNVGMPFVAAPDRLEADLRDRLPGPDAWLDDRWEVTPTGVDVAAEQLARRDRTVIPEVDLAVLFDVDPGDFDADALDDVHYAGGVDDIDDSDFDSGGDGGSDGFGGGGDGGGGGE